MEGRSGLLEAAAAVIVAAMGTLILAGALLTFSQTVRGGGTAARGAGEETGGGGSEFHIRVTFDRDGESVSQDGFLENVHIVETVRSDGILYSYVADSAAGRNGHDGA